MTAIWVALHMAVGDQNMRAGQKVSGSRAARINVNTDVDSAKVEIVEWLVAAAARVAEQMNIDDPQPRNNTDTEHARIVSVCTRIIGPNLDKLLAAGEDDVTIWLPSSQTPFPGERMYNEDHGREHKGVGIIAMSGTRVALKLRELHRDARALLALTTPLDKLSLPCPGCNQYELSRRHTRWGTSEIDQIDCGNCKLNWPYLRYRQLCLIWVKGDEMEREKLQRQLEEETKRRELGEWLLAKREWQLSLALECTDVSAAEFARTIVDNDVPEPGETEFMTDNDIAALIGVSDSTVRAWATRGHITRHTSDDGSALFHAREVRDYAKAAAGGRNATVRRLSVGRRAAS